MDRILVVEDDDCMNASLVAALANEYEVRAVTDGDAAVDFLDHNAVDLVLLDMVIPERDGLSVLSHIAGMAPKPQVV
ncbi:MAG: response regulator, partial [Candidatus Brocadiaceae bacterium]|nr:response regulator [Candidatus Brocadiaceae bacterium]